MDVELKPCPFCGGEPKFTEVGSDLSKSRKLTIQCKGCRFKLTNAAIRHGFDWLYEITITAWNNRHGDADRSAELTTAWMAGVESVRDQAAEAWRSIESAPDDGTPFLAYLPKERRTIQVGWQNKNSVIAIGSSFSFDLTPATHWRPLPAPPTNDAARAGDMG